MALVKMVENALIPQEGTNARVSGAGIQGGTVTKVSFAKEARKPHKREAVQCIAKSRYKYLES